MSKGKKKSAKDEPVKVKAGEWYSLSAAVKTWPSTATVAWSVSPTETSAPEPVELPVTTSTEPLTGFRRWNLHRRYPDGLYLASETVNVPWPPLDRFDAECRWPHTASHEAPHHACDCGIYAIAESVQVPFSDDDVSPHVVGEVYLWGRVIEHEHGYRAQYAYPKRLAVVAGDQRLADVLSLTYGVPAEVLS